MRSPALTFAILPCFAFIVALSGCKNSTSSQNGGFNVTTGQVYQSANGQFSPPQPIPAVPVAGIWVEPDPSTLPQGSIQSYGRDWNGLPNELDDPFTSSGDPSGLGSAYYFVVNGKAPGFWNHRFTFNFFCGNTDLVGTGLEYGDNGTQFATYSYALNNEYTFLHTGVQDNCYYNYNGNPGIPPASTRFAIVGQQPQTLTLTGQSPVMTQFGMPLLYIYDGSRNLVDTVTATDVSADRTQATFPFPSSLSSNAYSLALVNRTNTAPGISTAGTNLLSIAQSKTIAGGPFGVAAGALAITDTYKDGCDAVYGHGKLVYDITTTSSNSTFPVVSLYSSNQVVIGGSTIAVGANPTAVVVYNTNNVTHKTAGTCWIDQIVYSGTTRAIVANSGDNTISMLDIVNDVLLSNVTVGNRPVALAVTSDGSTVYVANYMDSTVSQVSLGSGTVTSTVAVGGRPTSLALSASGYLWVGGEGFITQINTQTMGIVATQVTMGRSIIALGFSDSVNELIATSVDTGGSVYAEEINPVSVQAGVAYTPVASHMVSSLGTHLNQVTGAQVRAFTSTLTGANTINTNQVGAPPLVVQDGWAVITATPTGFTVTDASGHIVLISETTPSPVTAIAVDAKLNVAYLTMPDSNILLTVPLPGTN